LKTALQKSNEIIKGLPPGQIVTGEPLSSQPYTDKFKIEQSANSNGYMVIMVSVEPDLQSNELLPRIENISPSNNLKKLDASLSQQGQKLIETIVTDDPFKKLIDQVQEKAKNVYKSLNPKPKRLYYRSPVPFSVPSSS
jgi:hypothetical protein